jgi:hypothetical protein
MIETADLTDSVIGTMVVTACFIDHIEVWVMGMPRTTGSRVSSRVLVGSNFINGDITLGVRMANRTCAGFMIDVIVVIICSVNRLIVLCMAMNRVALAISDISM